MAGVDLLDARTGSFPPFEATERLPRGTTIGRYVVIDVIGHGGMGVVYSAIDTQLGRKLAIKFVRDDPRSSAPVNTSRLWREAHALARLSHRNVVSIYDVGTYEDRVFLVMEYVEGKTLASWLATESHWRARLTALLSAGDGLAAAHDAAVIHRDFKPDNVIIGADSRVVVMDFGLAREAESDGGLLPGDLGSLPPRPASPSLAPLSSPPDPADAASLRPRARRGEPTTDPASSTSLSSPLTLGGKILGTVGFMAPEQAYGRATTVATDQFSYSVTLYFALYRRMPFAGDTVGSYVKSIYRTKLEPPPGSKVPLRIFRILQKGMSRKPEERYPSMHELLAALREDRRQRYWGWAAIASGAVAVAAVSATGAHLLGERRNVCASDPREWLGVWDDNVRAEARSAFVAAEPDTGEATFVNVARPIDAYVSQWNAMHVETCTATRVEQRQPEATYRLRSDCLSRRKTQLASVARLLEHADKGVVAKGLELSYGLDRVSFCADVDALRASTGLPDDPQKRAIAEVVRAKLADARTKFVAGRVDDALSVSNEAITLARNIDHAETIAEALYVRGDLLGEGESDSSAIEPMREAFFLAEGAGADAIVVKAATSLAAIAGNGPQKLDEAKTWLDTAKAALKRMGGNEELEIEISDAEAVIVSRAQGQPELALPLNEKVVAGYRKLYGAHEKTATALFNLGTKHMRIGDVARARTVLEETEAMDEQIGGPGWPNLGIARARLGWTLIALGEFDKGASKVRDALQILAHFSMEYRQADAFQSLAWMALAKGEFAQAVGFAEAAVRHHEKGKSAPADASSGDIALGLALSRSGRAFEALAHCEKSLVALDERNMIYADKPYGWDALRCEAEALIGLGRSGDAIPHLQRSLTLHRRTFPGDYARAQFALARALTAARRDASRATELATSARDELLKLPFLGFELREVDAWLAKRPKRPD